MRLTHNRSHTPEYTVWLDMKKRCDNPNCHCYHQYGGRGITYDPRWVNFEAFFEDMGERPSDVHTLDRIDCNGNYSVDNCRWATRSEQCFNRRQFFQRRNEPMRYIGVYGGSYRVAMFLYKGKRIYEYFHTLDEALDFRADTEMEREMHKLLGFTELRDKQQNLAKAEA